MFTRRAVINLKLNVKKGVCVWKIYALEMGLISTYIAVYRVYSTTNILNAYVYL